MVKASEYYRKYVKAANLPPTSTPAKTADVIDGALKSGLYDTPAEPKLPDGETPPEGGEAPAPPTDAPTTPEAPAEPKKAPELPPPSEPGKDGAPGAGQV